MTRRSKTQTPFDTKSTRKCDFKGCTEEGICKAPKDRTLKEYHWFCPKHAREYNERWDYCKEMSPEEIEEQIRNDIGWQRPTWLFGEGKTKVYDPFNLQKDIGIDLGEKVNEPRIRPEVKKALKVLNLTLPLGKEVLKQQYRTLAKQYHPDKNGGDKQAENLFKKISEAYVILLEFIAEAQK